MPDDWVGSPFQCEGFVRSFATARGARTVWLLAEDASGPFAALPLAIVRHGPWRVAEFPGGTHANANGTRSAIGRGSFRLSPAAVRSAAAGAGMRIDALDLCRIADPDLVAEDFHVAPAAEERFAISLGGGLPAVLERGNAKRKKKKFRAQQRHFETRGGYRFFDCARDERPAALAVFLAQKRDRFRALGMPNPFAEEGIAGVLLGLFAGSSLDSRLYCVESGGAMKAMIGGIVEGGTFWGMFSSFADDEDASASPGELLLWHLVERLSAEGLTVLDLGPGEERYKRSWCDRVVPQYDALAALTPAGRIYVALARARQAATRAVKGDVRLRSLAQRLRRLVGRR